MAIIKASDAPAKQPNALDPKVEAVINDQISSGVWEWIMDPEWDFIFSDIVDNLKLSGWACKKEVRRNTDPEVKPTWIIIKPL